MDVTTRMEMQPIGPSLAAQLPLCFHVSCQSEHLCDPRSRLKHLDAANIGITNFSRSSGHETASTNSERARGLRRLLQHMLDVQSVICRVNNHQCLVVHSSLQEEDRHQVAPQRERLDAMAEGTRVKIDARAAQTIHVLNERPTARVNDVGEKLVEHHGLVMLPDQCAMVRG